MASLTRFVNDHKTYLATFIDYVNNQRKILYHNLNKFLWVVVPETQPKFLPSGWKSYLGIVMKRLSSDHYSTDKFIQVLWKWSYQRHNPNFSLLVESLIWGLVMKRLSTDLYSTDKSIHVLWVVLPETQPKFLPSGWKSCPGLVMKRLSTDHYSTDKSIQVISSRIVNSRYLRPRRQLLVPEGADGVRYSQCGRI